MNYGLGDAETHSFLGTPGLLYEQETQSNVSGELQMPMREVGGQRLCKVLVQVRVGMCMCIGERIELGEYDPQCPGPVYSFKFTVPCQFLHPHHEALIEV